MKKIYYLVTCDDCRRVMKRLGGMNDFEKQEIKSEPVTANQLKEMRNLAGSYDALFSRKAIKYREMNLKDKSLSEDDIRDLILKDYTFLRRPVIILDKKIFISHQEETIAHLEKMLKK